MSGCVWMTQRRLEEVYIIPWRSSSRMSWKGTCFIWGLPHMGIYYVDCVSVSYDQITRLCQPSLDRSHSALYTAARMIFSKNKFGHCSPSSLRLNILTFPLTPRIKSNKVLICPQGSARSGFCLMLTLWELKPHGSPFTSLDTHSPYCYYYTCIFASPLQPS